MEGKTLREELRETINDLRLVIHKIAVKENATQEEIALLPGIASSITHITAYAVIEKKD